MPIVAHHFQVNTVASEMTRLPRRVHEGGLRQPPCRPAATEEKAACAETTQRCFTPNRSVAGRAVRYALRGPPGSYLGAIGNDRRIAFVDASHRWASGQ